MKIKRNVNGKEMEFELTFAELADAHTEYEFDGTFEDIKTYCDCDYEDIEITDDDIKRMVNKARHYISKCDSYYEVYWACVRSAVDDYMKNQTK